MQTSPLACRTACYGPLEPQVWPRLREFGISGVEIKTPPPDALTSVRRSLESAGLHAVTLHLACYLTRDDYLEQIKSQNAAIVEFGVEYALLTMRREAMPAAEAYRRIREIADALPSNVVALLEVHADLATNAATALETMHGVNHPRVRINYDPANIHFYNHGLDPIAELRAMMEFVAGVHLKETNGAFEARHFPAIGEGVIDWRGLFRELRAAEYAGPITLELEGVAGEEKTLDLALSRLAQSTRYLHEVAGFAQSNTP